MKDPKSFAKPIALLRVREKHGKARPAIVWRRPTLRRISAKLRNVFGRAERMKIVGYLISIGHVPG